MAFLLLFLRYFQLIDLQSQRLMIADGARMDMTGLDGVGILLVKLLERAYVYDLMESVEEVFGTGSGGLITDKNRLAECWEHREHVTRRLTSFKLLAIRLMSLTDINSQGTKHIAQSRLWGYAIIGRCSKRSIVIESTRQSCMLWRVRSLFWIV